MLLTDILLLLSVGVAHWLAYRLGIYEGLHEFMPGFCRCQH